MTQHNQLPDVSPLFVPGRLGQVDVRNRLVMTATGLGVYSTDLEEFRPNIESFVRVRAEGGVGAVILSALGPGRIDQPESSNERPAEVLFSSLAGIAHASGARIGMQLNHQGRQASPQNKYSYVAPSSVPWKRGLPPPQELSSDEVAQLVQRFGRAAAQAQEWGMDFVEIHAGHGYLIHQFLSPRSNKRQDAYGGEPLLERSRFLFEVLHSVRQAVGRDYTVGVRVSAEERTDDGMSVDEAASLAELVGSDGAADYLNASGGTYGSNPVIVAPYSVPYGFNLSGARRLKDASGLPTIVAGRMWDPHLMQETLATNSADFIGLGRALWADPDMPNKIREGRLDEIRYAIGCNQGCIDRVGAQRRTCLVNPIFGREHQFVLAPTDRRQRVVVVGGGISGMEAARILASRGHNVTLFERDPILGGRWRQAAQPPGKEEFSRLQNWLEKELAKSGADVFMATHADLQSIIDIHPDQVVLASGLEYSLPKWVPEFVLSLDTALAEPWRVADECLILGASREGLETALSLAASGRKVRVAGGDGVGRNMGVTARFHLLNQLKGLGVEVVRDLPAAASGAAELDRTLLELGIHARSSGSLSVVWTDERAPRHSLLPALREAGLPVHLIGDAKGGAYTDGLSAMDDAAMLAYAM